MRSVLIGLSCAAALLAGALTLGAMAQTPQLPPGAKLAPKPPSPGLKTPKVQAPCKVDLALRVTLFKVNNHPDGLRMGFRITNAGTSGEWKSGPEQQAVYFTLHKGSPAADVTGFFKIPYSGGPGVELANFNTGEYAIDKVSMRAAGYVDVRLGFDPDIAIDNNTCNDDANSANNHVRISGPAIADFYASSARQRDFGP